MNSADILKLVNAGYTKEEIDQMQSGQDQEQEQDQGQDQEQDQNQDQNQDQEQNQEQNQEIPEDDLMKKTDEAMAELIRPTYEKEEK